MDRDLKRVELMYSLILCLVVNGKKVQIKTSLFSVEFYGKNDMYYVKTKDVNASSKHFCSLYDLVKFSIADQVLLADIEVLTDDKLFAVIK